MAQAFTPNTQEVEAGGPGVQCHLRLLKEFETYIYISASVKACATTLTHPAHEPFLYLISGAALPLLQASWPMSQQVF